jgi:hypothetical protein
MIGSSCLYPPFRIQGELSPEEEILGTQGRAG